MAERRPTAEQQAVIDHRGSHLRLLAPPGTGKTDSTAGRVDSLMTTEQLAAEDILVLSFSRLAAKELGDRLREIRKGQDFPGPSTVHAYALQQLREHHLTGLCGSIIIDDWEMKSFFRQDIADRIGGSGAAAERLLNAMQADWRTLKDEDAPLPVERAALEDALRALRVVYDFALLGELVYRLKRWAEQQPDFRPAFRQVLVDEYQDLNRCEQALIELVQARSGAELLVAGDDDQSIYGWRQANMQGIRDFPDQFSASDYSLTECWRSGQSIINHAWSVIEQVPGRPASRKRPVSKRDFPGEVKVVAARSAQAAPKDVARLVQKLTTASEPVSSGDVMILVPRKAFAASYETELHRLGVPAANLAQAEKILDKPAVRRLLYLARIKLNPQDAVALRALLFLQGRIGPARIKPLVEAVATGRHSFSDVVRSSDDSRIQTALEVIDKVPHVTGEDLALDAFQSLASATGMAPDDLEPFLELARGITGDENMPLAQFLTALAEFQVRPAAPSADSSGPVRIMTMRQAKGLSASVVIVTDLDDEIVPGTNDTEEIHEQRRLLYVSMTRAERLLYLFFCGRRARDMSRWAGMGSRRGPRDQRTISRFLDGSGITSVSIEQLTA